jgi:hypothetical protein
VGDHVRAAGGTLSIYDPRCLSRHPGSMSLIATFETCRPYRAMSTSSGMTSRDSAELNRMVSEKVAAATSGAVAAQTETMRIAARILTGKKTPHAATAVVAAALKLALRTVKANAKRLGKKRSKKRKSAAR